MFTLKPIAVCISMLTVASAALAQAPQFGQPIAPADIAAWDISIGPDGVGLPPGRGTAIEGEAIYVASCQACHGEKGTRPNDALAGALVGGMGTLAPDKTPMKTVEVSGPMRQRCSTMSVVQCHSKSRNRSPRTKSTQYRPISSISTGSSGRTMCSMRSRCPRSECRTGTGSSRSPAIRSSFGAGPWSASGTSRHLTATARCYQARVTARPSQNWPRSALAWPCWMQTI